MVTIREELKSDIAPREALLDATFGDARFDKAAERLRENHLPAEKLSFIAAEATRVVGTVRLWNIRHSPSMEHNGWTGSPCTAARPARSRERPTQPRNRYKADASCAPRSTTVRVSRNPAGRRHALLRSLRFHSREDRRAVASRFI